ncbi:MAG: ABC transporter permease [Dehalococcoidia bacterium]|nr:ABC transporter permease [Dehalococcoidia bacterium]
MRANLTACLALFERDLSAIRRSRSQVYSSVLTPLLLLIFLGTGVSRGLQPSSLPAGNFTAYLVPGVVVMTAVFAATFASASYYRDRDSGVLRMLLSSPASSRTVLLGKSMAGVTLGTVQAFAVLVIAAPFVDFEWQHGVFTGLLLSVATIVLLNLVLAGVAQALASRIETMQGFHLLMNLVLFPLLFFSGAFFPVENLPVWLEVLARINPLSYAVDALLLAAYADSSTGFFGLTIDFAVLGGLAIVVYALGFARMPRLTWSGK